MNDQELLTYAAKAIDLKWLSYHHLKGLCCRDDKYGGLIEYYWNPLLNDADAFQLMVKLRLEVYVHENESAVIDGNIIANTIQNHNGDPYAATRRAIVMAAAEIGKGM